MQGDEIARHKGLGIASFILAIVTLSGIFMAIVLAGLMSVNGSATPTLKMIVGFAMLFFLLLDVVGIAVGIAGVVDRTSKKTFPVMGIALCTGTLVLRAVIVAVGLWAKHS
jgi:hypothetical protein